VPAGRGGRYAAAGGRRCSLTDFEAPKAPARTAVKWAGLSQLGRQLLQLATTICLARILAPNDFGLMAMAVVGVGFLHLFRDLGTSAALIQHSDAPQALLTSVLWLNLVFALATAAALYAAAPALAAFFAEPALTLVLRLLACGLVLSALGATHQALLERSLRFATLAKIELGATIASSAVALASAAAGAGVLSLVFQSLSLAALSAALLWKSHPWRPAGLPSWSALRGIAGYSGSLAGFNTFNYFARNADYVLVGRFLGAQELGYYSIAYRAMLLPVTSLSGILGRVAFPHFSRLQREGLPIRLAYLRVARAIAFVAFPLSSLVVVSADLLVEVGLGPSWLPVVPVLMILAPVGMLQALGATMGAIYQATGRTDLQLRWGGASGAVYVSAFAVGLPWGIVGVAAAYAAAVALIAYPAFRIPLNLIELRLGDLLGAVSAPALSSAIMAAGCTALRCIPGLPASAAAQLAIVSAAAVILYAGASVLLNRQALNEVLALAFPSHR
jgi:O-antigen/teichoic acid export membrane protein